MDGYSNNRASQSLFGQHPSMMDSEWTVAFGQGQELRYLDRTHLDGSYDDCVLPLDNSSSLFLLPDKGESLVRFNDSVIFTRQFTLQNNSERCLPGRL